ncbi:MAG: DNA-binding protein [Candidatus Micrarchaeia archaeon]
MDEDKVLAAQQAELQLKKTLSVILEENAYARLMNVRLSNQELYLKVANALIHYYQKIRRRITEKELLTIINMNLAVSKQPETKIHIRRK